MSGEQFYALSELEQRLQIADDLEERGKCPECGRPREDCLDGNKARYPLREICYASMALAAFRRRYDEMHEDKPFHNGQFKDWREKADDGHPFHYLDGVTLLAVDEDPGGIEFLTTRMSDQLIGGE